VRRDALQVIRVQEEVALEALNRVEHRREADAEDEHRLRVRLPVLLVAAPAAKQPQEAALDRIELLARVSAGHEDPERVTERDERDAVEQDLGDALAAHPLQPLAPEEGVHEISEDEQRNRKPEDVRSRHQTCSRT